MKFKFQNPKIIVIVVMAAAIALGVIIGLAIKNRAAVVPSVSTAPAGITAPPSSVVPPPQIPSVTSSVPLQQKQSNKFEGKFSYPYPVSWKEGQSELFITGASLENNKLTLALKVRVGNTYECIPLNLRLLLNEEGDMERPITQQFQFPDSGGCQGTPNTTYNDQYVVFSVASVVPPFFITTGGLSNVYFKTATTTNSGIEIQIPEKSG